MTETAEATLRKLADTGVADRCVQFDATAAAAGGHSEDAVATFLCGHVSGTVYRITGWVYAFSDDASPEESAAQLTEKFGPEIVADMVPLKPSAKPENAPAPMLPEVLEDVAGAMSDLADEKTAVDAGLALHVANQTAAAITAATEPLRSEMAALSEAMATLQGSLKAGETSGGNPPAPNLSEFSGSGVPKTDLGRLMAGVAAMGTRLDRFSAARDGYAVALETMRAKVDAVPDAVLSRLSVVYRNADDPTQSDLAVSAAPGYDPAKAEELKAEVANTIKTAFVEHMPEEEPFTLDVDEITGAVATAQEGRFIAISDAFSEVGTAIASLQDSFETEASKEVEDDPRIDEILGGLTAIRGRLDEVEAAELSDRFTAMEATLTDAFSGQSERFTELDGAFQSLREALTEALKRNEEADTPDPIVEKLSGLESHIAELAALQKAQLDAADDSVDAAMMIAPVSAKLDAITATISALPTEDVFPKLDLTEERAGIVEIFGALDGQVRRLGDEIEALAAERNAMAEAEREAPAIVPASPDDLKAGLDGLSEKLEARFRETAEEDARAGAARIERLAAQLNALPTTLAPDITKGILESHRLSDTLAEKIEPVLTRLGAAADGVSGAAEKLEAKADDVDDERDGLQLLSVSLETTIRRLGAQVDTVTSEVARLSASRSEGDMTDAIVGAIDTLSNRIGEMEQRQISIATLVSEIAEETRGEPDLLPADTLVTRLTTEIDRIEKMTSVEKANGTSLRLSDGLRGKVDLALAEILANLAKDAKDGAVPQDA